MVNQPLNCMKIKLLIRKYWLLIIIILLAGFLRLWKLSSVPPHLTPYEASLGYNAFSILKTGRDEYGKLLPIIFKSFGDYKPGLYIYLSVPFVGLLGLNEWAVRLPSAVCGVLTVFLIYLIAKKLFPGKKIGIFAAFVAATNPWLIYFSRGAWEVNVCLTLALAGTYFFLKFLTRSKFLLFSAFFFALTLLCYQGAKLSSGIVLLILVILYWKNVFSSNKKILAGSLLIGIMVSLPIILSLFQGRTGRLNVFSVFSYPRPAEYLQKQLAHGNENMGSLSYYVFHSETVNFARGVMGRWFNHFSGRFLFFEGDWQNPRHTAPNSGVLLTFDLILLILGIVSFIKVGWEKETLFIWLWLILAPLTAALSRDQVHAVRALNMSVPLIIILSFGFFSIIRFLNTTSRPFVKVTGYFLLLFSYILSLIYFLDSYYVHLPKHDSQYWEYGYKQIVQKVTPIQNKYKMIKVQQSYAQPYIFFLFFQEHDPAKYQKQAELIESSFGDVGQVEKLDNIYFSPIDWSVNRGEHNVLFVADPIRIPPEDSKDTNLFYQIAEIKYLNGRDTAFRLIEVK